MNKNDIKLWSTVIPLFGGLALIGNGIWGSIGVLFMMLITMTLFLYFSSDSDKE